MNNRTLMQEMLHCTDMTVLERQRARCKWQEQQQQQIQLAHEQQQQQLGLLDSCFGDFNGVFQLHHQQQQLGFQGGSGELLTTTQLSSVKPDPNLVDDNMWDDVAGFGPNCGLGDNSNGGSGFEMNFAISRTSSCPPAAASAAAVKNRDSDVSDKISCGAGRDSFKKRKHDKVQTNPEVVAEEDSSVKKIKICADEGEPKITEKNNNNRSCSSSSDNNNKSTNNIKENSPETSKDDNSKVTEVQKPDYIHVRARRGQATDSHSLAERVRREKISERMKYLQDLVPGCDKITGKAGMLDEIINYVQSLQRQVEFLSMKLATVNPRLDFNIGNSFAKEAYPACAPNFSTIGMSSEMTNPAAYIQFNPEQQQQQQIVSCGGLDMVINAPDMGVRRTISAPIPVPETYFDSSCFSQIQPSPAWDADLQNLYNVAFDQARSTNSFPSHQPFTGSVGAGNMKMEM